VNQTYNSEKVRMGAHALIEKIIDISKDERCPNEEDSKERKDKTQPIITGQELAGRYNVQKTGRDSILGLMELVGKADSGMKEKLDSLVELRKEMLKAEALLFEQVPVTEKQAKELEIDKNLKEVEFKN